MGLIYKRGLNFIIPPAVFAVLALTIIMISCANKTDATKEGSGKRINFNILEGKRLYLHYCSPCHGEDGQGDGKYYASNLDPRPPDLINSSYFKENKKGRIFKAIKFGSRSIGKTNLCPPYGKTLRDEEIRYVIKYLDYIAKQG